MDTGLKGQKVLIMGSSRGIGFGIAQCFVQEGADIILTGRKGDDLDQASARLKALSTGEIVTFQGDLFQEGIIGTLQKMLSHKYGRLDHLVCNIGSGRSVAAGNEDILEVRRMMDINFFHAVQAVHSFRSLLRRDIPLGNELSSITLIGSICGRQVLGCPAGYAAAKAALVYYAKNLAAPLAKDGIRINVVSPGNIIFSGSVWEKKLNDGNREIMDMLDKNVPLKKFGIPQDIGSAVVYVSSRCAGFMTGTELVVDGGQTV